MSAANPMDITGPTWSGNVQQPDVRNPVDQPNQTKISVNIAAVPDSHALCTGTAGPNSQGNNQPA